MKSKTVSAGEKKIDAGESIHWESRAPFTLLCSFSLSWKKIKLITLMYINTQMVIVSFTVS